MLSQHRVPTLWMRTLGEGLNDCIMPTVVALYVCRDGGLRDLERSWQKESAKEKRELQQSEKDAKQEVKTKLIRQYGFVANPQLTCRHNLAI